ncbi:MAG TPA: selenocysteine-specific translation elongation factor [Anaerolineae bacterium]|nr:selenocysteine-specific translation elongation factor [Anaerolineae bacterium]HQJ50167.1 selenocysteine-specific translation elongation factor [Anaerolineae bacterium]
MRVIGTAGHVDHGKSTLVQAITGINPDRLKEEQEREMTIDLGFAWLRLPSGLEASIVDVPGHEDFIKNMLAGVGGIDLALFVVAADEGVMPQTREHLAILDLLQVRDVIVALTKSDLIDDPEWLELVKEDVRKELQGTTLAEARIIPVSARTGQGLSELLQELDRLLQAPSPRMERGHPRLPIDRVFSIAGFGTIVTGTLVDGRLHNGEELEILPGNLKARIRGLQTHKARVETAIPPTRLAVNITGVDKEALRRGDVLATPGWLRATQMLDVRLHYLRDATRPLTHNTVLDFFSGTAQVEARVRLLDCAEVAPGGEAWAQLVLDSPVAVLKGDRFILRQASPSLTLAGGSIVDALPQQRHKRFHAETIRRLESLARGSPAEVLLQELEREQPTEAGSLISHSSLGAELARMTLAELLSDRSVLPLDPSLTPESVTQGNANVLSSAGWQLLLQRITQLLGEYHSRYPLRAGMPREELKSRLSVSPRVFNEAVDRASSEKVLAKTESTVALASHQVRFSNEQQRQIDTLLKVFSQNPYSPPSFAECEAEVGPDVLAALIQQGTLVKLSDTVLFDAGTYEETTRAVIAHLRREGRITLAQVRDMFSTSRKYAQALLEHLDDKRVTQRVGDERLLR